MERITCPYCNQQAKLIDGKEIYPHRPDLHAHKFWLCRPCDAYVGTHKNSKQHVPLGPLANADLRGARMRAHAVFDGYWKRGDWTRRKAYAWLAEKLGTEVAKCHIGRFDLEMCRRVVEVCAKGGD